MRKSLIKCIGLIVLSLGFAIQAIAQCAPEKFTEQCSALLDNYIYIKAFNIDHKENDESTEHSYLFCKNTSYLIAVFDENSSEDKVVVELYDKNKKIVSSNYNEKTNKFYSKIGLNCTSTGVYYMKYRSLSGKPVCALSNIGFKRN